MSDLVERLEAFETSDELGNGDFSLLREAAAALEAAREDAERLDWLADQMRITDVNFILGSLPLNSQDLRAAIDQARGKGVAG
ncbi:hypothetical protein LY625_03940 [Lysobacter sp. GX 14042]|uniref:hypothetical protein n=1 Tax=Lysobacter sp. GX 14042 TaxID=2907155 RepID=UPI001F48B9D8|nr:hypothetical protein [Lysobacter sp. GX 14042]MCE7031774.1 hypothetical protein [Lysobacter sp. GX 14042]